VGERLIREILNRLKFLLEVGLDYLTLDRMTFTLSGGEAQRINLAAALSASLVGTLFILDEPSIGLHPRDNQRLVSILQSLKNRGNTVVVVEHDPEISYLTHQKTIPLPPRRRQPQGYILVHQARKHNLKNIDIRIPLHVFTCITGVSGSGKSTLLSDVLYQGISGASSDGFKKIEGKELVHKASPLSSSPRSIPATYTKAMDEIREIFSQTREARLMGYPAGFFSFNTRGGRCEECKGAGQQIIEMQFLSDVVLPCEACKGKRFKSLTNESDRGGGIFL